MEYNSAMLFLTTIGLLVLLLLYLFFFKHSSRVKRNLVSSIEALNDVNVAIFSGLLAKDYDGKKFLYEKNCHDKKAKFYYAFNQSRIKKNGYAAIYQTLENIYSALITLGLVSYRVKDHATFDVIHKELYAISSGVSDALLNVKKYLVSKVPAKLGETILLESLTQLEEVYHSALQVVAADPKVFLVLIYDLRRLFECIDAMVSLIETLHAKKNDDNEFN
jgi:hypothetical protein